MRPLALVLALSVGALAACSERPPDRADRKDPAMAPTPTPSTHALATFGGGCFWCTEAIFQRLDGVLDVRSGYAAGRTDRPTYKEVCEGTTGHAEVIQVRYDPARIPYEALLQVFFKTHDPTTLNRQGADVGTQYRSIVLWHDEAQRQAATEIKAALDAAKVFPAPIVTEIAPYTVFHAAEDYHQGYFDANPTQGYCRAVIAPKIEKFEKVFAERLKARGK